MLIRRLGLDGLLSFGPHSHEIELGPLNVLIGPNGSGKSNLIDAISLLKAAPVDITLPIRFGGGIGEWIWKGDASLRHFRIRAELQLQGKFLEYLVAIEDVGGAPRIDIEELTPKGKGEQPAFSTAGGSTTVRQQPPEGVVASGATSLPDGRIDPRRSVLAQLRGPAYPEITSVTDAFFQIQILTDWTFGRSNRLRRPSPPDLPGQALTGDLTNLGAVLNRLQRDYTVKTALKEKMALVFDGAEDVHVSVENGALQIVVQERAWSIPASRLSDGTLRWLFLIALLLDPQPAPLICIEEPELGLHPDLIPEVSKMLVEASSRTQLIVTTHSHVLVDAFTETPENVLVCEKENGSTHLRRLEQAKLKRWLKDYSLGHLWSSGEIGGNRW